MKKIMIIFGTRPEAIKLCPIIIELLKHKDRFTTVICVTGQHKELLEHALRTFNISPDYDLNIMRKNQSLPKTTSLCLEKVNNILNNDKPDLVIVQGDTTTTFASSLSAFYNKIKVAHVEAGLRSNDNYSPFPEEINRKITSLIADIHFAPTENNKNNLIREGIKERKILVTGNTVIDALLWVKNKIKEKNIKYKELKNVDFNKKIILVTGHRRENFGDNFKNIFEALKYIAEKNDIKIVYPVHLNPNVQRQVYGILNKSKNILLIEPLLYEPFIYLMDKCHFIISDSGGIQEEAPTFNKPVLVTRDVTERIEVIKTGAAILVGANIDCIIKESERLIHSENHYKKMSNICNPYGDGNSSKRIVKYIINNL